MISTQKIWPCNLHLCFHHKMNIGLTFVPSPFKEIFYEEQFGWVVKVFNSGAKGPQFNFR